jgi:PemK-like, MazF-like toxin of type II toxin-antitoxin system
MSLPEPELGLVISYSYVWRDEAAQGREEGVKDRPCVIVTAVEPVGNGEAVVTVMPITHREPDDPAKAVEIPLATKQRLGLDAERSWVIVNEGNKFVWPGYDLRKIPGRDTYHYGFLPPNLFQSILSKAGAWLKQHGIEVTRR